MLIELISFKSQSQVHEQGEAYVTPMGCHLTMPGSTHITVIKLHMLRTQTESDFAEVWYWLRNQRRHQVDNEAFELASEGRSS